METKALYKRLLNISQGLRTKQRILIGQQNAFNEGRGWRHNNNDLGSPLKSDMQEVAGVHPAVYGVDFNEIGHWNEDFIKERIELVVQAKGIFTLSWHMKAWVKDGRGDESSKDTTTKVTARILPGGDHHEKYKLELDRLVTFMKSISHIPVIFRPFHEHNGYWFWWGQLKTSEKEYIALWRMTIDYLREKGVHNMLLAYSPAEGAIYANYLDRYPGDDYVDIFGIDMYFRSKLSDLFEHGNVSPLYRWKRSTINLLKLASARKKIPALTEFGQEGVTYNKFWTDYMSWPMERDGMLQYINYEDLPELGYAYAMLWRNDISDPKHYYGPIPNHKNNKNFMEMLSKGIYLGLEVDN
jgi:mannan endo-1,4-beta-mannosidase